MKQRSQNSGAVLSALVSRVLSMREILFAYWCILLSESICLFPGFLLR